MLFILSESRAFCTFFASRVSKIQVVAKMHKMHTIQNKRQRKRALYTFFAFQFDKRETKSDLNLMKGEKYADRTFKENG